MKRILVPTLLAVFSTATLAHEGHEHGKKDASAARTVTLTGEVVDLYCYMQHPETAVGSEHAKCAKSCINKGLPIGFLTTDGVLYAIIGKEHEPVGRMVVDYAGTSSTITGSVLDHHGMKAIELGTIGATGSKVKAPASASTEPAATFTCSMHPEVNAGAPGNCPKCGMKLEKKN